MKRWLVYIVIAILPVMAFGQLKSQAKPADMTSFLRNPFAIGQNAAGLLGLDPSRLTMSQSYQMSFMSIGGKGFTQGLYLNTMMYEFSSPLSLAVQWGIAHQPLSSFGGASLLNNGPFLSGAQLRYRPAKNFSVELEYSQYPGGYYYGPYRRSLLDQ